MSLLILIWAIVGVLVFLWGMGAVRAEPTAHGQGILLPLAIVQALFWPLALGWSAIVAVGLGAQWVWGKVRSIF